MNHSKLHSKLGLASIILILFLATSASALELGEAKSQGLVGETPSGYLASVTASPPGEVKKLIDDVNMKRRAQYQKIAEANGTPLSAVEKVAAEKAIAKAGPGEMIRLSDGTWKKR